MHSHGPFVCTLHVLLWTEITITQNQTLIFSACLNFVMSVNNALTIKLN